MRDHEFGSPEEILETLADGITIDWERLEKEGALSPEEAKKYRSELLDLANS